MVATAASEHMDEAVVGSGTTPSSSYYEDFGDTKSSNPSAVAQGVQLHVFARGPWGGLHHNWWDPRDRIWRREDLGGSFAADPGS